MTKSGFGGGRRSERRFGKSNRAFFTGGFYQLGADWPNKLFGGCVLRTIRRVQQRLDEAKWFDLRPDKLRFPIAWAAELVANLLCLKIHVFPRKPLVDP